MLVLLYSVDVLRVLLEIYIYIPMAITNPIDQLLSLDILRNFFSDMDIVIKYNIIEGAICWH